MDYEEMSEPNMKLSRALLIVLVLHVVAVAGIIAFNAIKTRQGGLPPPPMAKSANVNAADASTQSPRLRDSETDRDRCNRDEEKPKHSARCERGTEEQKRRSTRRKRFGCRIQERSTSSPKATIR